MKKLLTALGALATATSAFAGATGVAGTRLGGGYAPPSTPTTGVGFGALAQMMLALAIVAFLLKWVLPRIAGKITKKLVTSPEGGIQVEESAQFAGGSLYIISARGKSLLISVAGTNVTTLTELSDPSRSPADPFEVALAEAQSRPAPSKAELDTRAALDRLTHLTAGHAR
jgi:flagellar biogenesis protein FliO